MTEFLDIAGVAERLALSTKAVRRAIDRGELRATKVCGRIRVRQDDVDAWVEVNTIKPDRRSRALRPVGRPAEHGLRAMLADETREEHS